MLYAMVYCGCAGNASPFHLFQRKAATAKRHAPWTKADIPVEIDATLRPNLGPYMGR